MINPYSHIILYAKGWYEKGDVWGDMKIIVGEWGGCLPEHITKADILYVIVPLTEKMMDSNTKFSASKFILDTAYGIQFSDEDIETRILKTALSFLRHIPVRDKKNGIIVELDPPDTSILPLSDSGILNYAGVFK